MKKTFLLSYAYQRYKQKPHFSDSVHFISLKITNERHYPNRNRRTERLINFLESVPPSLGQADCLSGELFCITGNSILGCRKGIINHHQTVNLHAKDVVRLGFLIDKRDLWIRLSTLSSTVCFITPQTWILHHKGGTEVSCLKSQRYPCTITSMKTKHI